MWRSGPDGSGDETTVVCIACGGSLPRADAREYDKEGDRWSRRGKDFEHLCKECYRGLCHQPRDDLEAMLVDIADDDISQEAFLKRYYGAVEERDESREEPES
ncbi:DUF7562 family protein [Haloplanus halobius]|uniref:DUF7562 family protein n=1 Tax=Haloplanus halobius TaxID=2934938 RepID=UPI00200C3F25|nr:hypothetical protein [Haloplanus sp. XH21]